MNCSEATFCNVEASHFAITGKMLSDHSFESWIVCSSSKSIVDGIKINGSIMLHRCLCFIKTDLTRLPHLSRILIQERSTHWSKILRSSPMSSIHTISNRLISSVMHTSSETLSFDWKLFFFCVFNLVVFWVLGAKFF